MRDGKDPEGIPKTIQLIAGRTGQEYNQRKDRYHATAVEADSHLFQCMVYIDLNMVRAGVIDPPSEWAFCGYNEILNPRRRYSLMDYEGLMDLLAVPNLEELQKVYKRSIKGGWRSRWRIKTACASQDGRKVLRLEAKSLYLIQKKNWGQEWMGAKWLGARDPMNSGRQMFLIGLIWGLKMVF